MMLRHRHILPYRSSTIGSHFLHGGKGSFQNYNTDQKAAINKLKERGIDIETVYLFFVNESKALKANDSPDVVNGYMPHGYQFGFIYNELNNYRTIAHEICHGAFHLKHTFDTTDYLAPERTTDNLMDYNGGETLNHWQWKDIHQPKSVRFKWLQDEEEAESVADAIAMLAGYDYAYIKKCGETTSRNETQSKHKEMYKVIGKKISGGYAIETVNLDYTESGLSDFFAEDFIDAILIFDAERLVNACELAPPVDADICSIATLEGQESVIKRIDDAAQNCTSEYVFNILQTLNTLSHLRVEYSLNGKSYRLVDGQIQESTLSDDDINNGNWEDGSIEQILRLGRSADGIIQVEALGFHKDLKSKGVDWNGNRIEYSVDLAQLTSDIKTTTNKYLKQNNVTTLYKTPDSAPNDVFPGNQTIVLDDNSPCLKLVLKGLDIAKNFLKNAEFAQDVYLSNSQAEIKLPAFATGTTESIARSVTDITSMVSFIYDMIFDDNARHQTVEGFKAIKDQVIEDYSMLFPLLRDIVLEEVTGANAEQYSEIVDELADTGLRNHLSSKVAVRTAVSVFAGGKIIGDLPKMAFELARKISLAKGFKRFNLRDAQDIYRTFFDDFNFADQSVKKKFLDNPNYVDAWIFFKQYDVDASLRQNFGAMDAFLAKRAGKEIPAPETYLSKEFIARHLAKFEDGVAFIFTKQDVVSSRYKSFSPNKFVMPKSDIKKIVSKYKETGSIEFLEDALGYKRGALSGKDIYVLEIEKPKVKLPIGNEAGANEFWLPGGKNSGGYNEAVFRQYSHYT